METSLAEDVQEQKMTLLPESFFFMSPYPAGLRAGAFRNYLSSGSRLASSGHR